MTDMERQRAKLVDEARALLAGWTTGSADRSESGVRQEGPVVEMTTPSGVADKPLVSTHEAQVGLSEP